MAAAGCSFTLLANDQYCEEYEFLPISGPYPPRLSPADEHYDPDPAQECANRCLHEFADVSVIVGGVDPGLGWFNLADHIRPAGETARPDCWILDDFFSAETKFGICTFGTAEEARTATATRNGTELVGQTIVVWGAVSDARVGIDAHVMDIYQGFYTAMVNSSEVSGSSTEERCVCCTDIDEVEGPWENVSAKVYTVSDCAAPPTPPPSTPLLPPLPPPNHAAGSAAPAAVGAMIGVLVLLGAGVTCWRWWCRLGRSSDSQRSKGDRNRAASEALEAFSKSTDEEALASADEPPLWVTELNPAALQAQREAEAAQIALAEDAEAKMAAASEKLRQAQAKAAESRLMDMAD